ncbi:hypothetical protein D3C75_686240 [compost metagenome]
MEGTHGKLGSRLTDGLSGNNADSFTDFHEFTCCQVTSVAFFADTVTGTAAQYRADLQLSYTSIYDFFSLIRVNQIVTVNDDFLSLRMTDSFERVAAFNTVVQILNNFLTILDTAYCKAFISTAIFFTYDYVLGHVYETAGQVTGIRCTQRCIGKTFTRSVRRDKVLEDGQTFTEVRFNR